MCGSDDARLDLIDGYDIDLPAGVEVVKVTPLSDPNLMIVTLADRGGAEWTPERIADKFAESRANLSAQYTQGEIDEDDFHEARDMQNEQEASWRDTGIVSFFFGLLHPMGLEIRPEPYISRREACEALEELVEYVETETGNR